MFNIFSIYKWTSPTRCEPWCYSAPEPPRKGIETAWPAIKIQHLLINQPKLHMNTLPNYEMKMNTNLNQQYKAIVQMNTNQHEQSLNHTKPHAGIFKTNLLVFHTDAVMYILFVQHVYQILIVLPMWPSIASYKLLSCNNSKHESMFSFTHIRIKYQNTIY